MIKKAKKSYYQSLLENKKSNTSSIWKVFSEFPGGTHNTQTSRIHSLLVNDTIVTDQTDIANVINYFFHQHYHQVKRTSDRKQL